MLLDLSDASASFWDTQFNNDYDPGGEALSLASGGFTSAGNIRTTSTTGTNIAVSAADLIPDISVSAEVFALSTSNMGIVFRYVDTSNFWLYRIIGGGTTQLYKFTTAGGAELIGTGSAASSNTYYTLTAVARGDNIQCFINGSLDISVENDPDLNTAKLAGVRSTGSGNKFRNLEAKSIGSDIRVFDEQAEGLVELPREVVSCDPVTETGEVWVKVPSLSSSADTVLQVHVDGSSSDYDSATDLFGRNEVWSDYGFVSHDGGPTDSTGNTSTMTAGGYCCWRLVLLA
jgi:hypothetical protein